MKTINNISKIVDTVGRSLPRLGKKLPISGGTIQIIPSAIADSLNTYASKRALTNRLRKINKIADDSTIKQ